MEFQAPYLKITQMKTLSIERFVWVFGEFTRVNKWFHVSLERTHLFLWLSTAARRWGTSYNTYPSPLSVKSSELLGLKSQICYCISKWFGVCWLNLSTSSVKPRNNPNPNFLRQSLRFSAQNLSASWARYIRECRQWQWQFHYVYPRRNQWLLNFVQVLSPDPILFQIRHYYNFHLSLPLYFITDILHDRNYNSKLVKKSVIYTS